MKEKYVVENEANEYMQIVWLSEEQANAIKWVIDMFCMGDISICKLSDYPAEEID